MAKQRSGKACWFGEMHTQHSKCLECGVGGRQEQGGVNPGLCLHKKLGFHPAGNGQELKVFKMRNGMSKWMSRNNIH